MLPAGSKNLIFRHPLERVNAILGSWRCVVSCSMAACRLNSESSPRLAKMHYIYRAKLNATEHTAQEARFPLTHFTSLIHHRLHKGTHEKLRRLHGAIRWMVAVRSNGTVVQLNGTGCSSGVRAPVEGTSFMPYINRTKYLQA